MSLRSAVRHKRAWFVVGGSIAILFGLAMIARLPRALTRRLVVATAHWTITEPFERKTGRGAFKRLVALYAQYNVAAGFRSVAHPADSLPDEQRLLAYLVPLRRAMLNQSELAHAPVNWPPILSGLGYCDQMNGMAATVLSGEYPTPQLVGVVNPNTGGGHTVGRIWSTRRNEWLYFDLWGRIVVFRLDNRTPQVLASDDSFTSDLDERTQSTIRDMYSYVADGFVFNEYAPTFGGYLVKRLLAANRSESPPAASATSGAVVEGRPASRVSDVPGGIEALEEQTYAAARVDQLFGDIDAARREYAAVGDSAGILSSASRRFLRRLQ